MSNDPASSGPQRIVRRAKWVDLAVAIICLTVGVLSLTQIAGKTFKPIVPIVGQGTAEIMLGVATAQLVVLALFLGSFFCR